MKELMEAINSTIESINYSKCDELKGILIEHLKYLLELQRATIARYDAGKIVWSE